MRSDSPDELDRILDAALANYASEEPRPGLERRVIRRVRSASGERRVWLWQWAVTMAAVASLVLAAVLFRPTPPTPPVARKGPSEPPAVVSRIAPERPPRVAPARPRRVVHRPVVASSALPKRDVFPALTPMNEQERAVLNLVARFPEQAHEILSEAAHPVLAPIEIEQIQIPPLPGGSER